MTFYALRLLAPKEFTLCTYSRTSDSEILDLLYPVLLFSTPYFQGQVQWAKLNCKMNA